MLERVPDRVADSSQVKAIKPVASPILGSVPSRPSSCETPEGSGPPYSDNRSGATLTMLSGAHAGRMVCVGPTGVTIGRSTDAELVVDDPGVSERHARVARNPDGGLYIADLGSANGTFVGGERIGVSLLRREQVLRIGPRIRIRFLPANFDDRSLYRRRYDLPLRDPLFGKPPRSST